MKTQLKSLFMITLIGCLATFGADVYAPSLPAIAHDLNTNISLSQLSMVVYMALGALGQLVFGPISDGIGRRKTLLIGLVLTTFGIIICRQAGDINQLIAGRCLQGFGTGAAAVLWRSMFRDLYHGPTLAKYGSYLTTLIIFIMPTAPVIGGYLQQHYGWRSNFTFLLCYSILTLLVAIFMLKETNATIDRANLRLATLKQSFKTLLSDRLFIGCCACVFVSYGALFSWVVVAPILLIHLLHIKPSTFGWIFFATNFISMGIGGICNGRLVQRFGISTMSRIGWGIASLSGVFMLIGYWQFGINLAAIALPGMLLILGLTFIWPNMFATGFSNVGNIAGFASALYGCLQIGGGAVLGSLAAHLPEHNQLPLACIILLAPLTAWLIFETTVKPAMGKA